MGGGWKKVFLPTFLSLNTNFIPRTSNPPTIFEPNRPNIFHPVVMHMNEIQTIERLIPHDSQMLSQQKHPHTSPENNLCQFANLKYRLSLPSKHPISTNEMSP
jgi:hypothetical protein